MESNNVGEFKNLILKGIEELKLIRGLYQELPTIAKLATTREAYEVLRARGAICCSFRQFIRILSEKRLNLKTYEIPHPKNRHYPKYLIKFDDQKDIDMLMRIRFCSGNKTNKKRIRLYIPIDLFVKLELLAKNNNKSVSRVIEETIEKIFKYEQCH